MRRYFGQGQRALKSRAKMLLARAGYCSGPAFLVIGAQKSGTAALFTYLALHPDIAPASDKEIGYFDQDVRFRKGAFWYHAHFPLPYRLGPHGVTFEATPEYLYYPAAPQRLHQYNPAFKLIVLLRDPVQRAYSAWNMFRKLAGRRRAFLRQYARERDRVVQDMISEMLAGKFPDFAQAVRNEIEGAHTAALEPSYVRRGLYDEQLGRYLRYFDRSQLLVVKSGRFKSHTAQVLNEIVDFLDLPAVAWHPKDLTLQHLGSYEAPLDKRTRGLLREFYRPHNEALYAWLGRDLGWERPSMEIT